MELTEILKSLSEAQVDPKEFAKALHEQAPDLYTHLFNAGHSKARSEYDDKLKAKDGEIEKLNSAVGEYKSSVEQLSMSKPDLAEVEDKWKAANNKLAKQLEELDAKYSEKESALLGRIQSVNTDRYRSNVVSWLVSQGVDRDYAEIKTQDKGFMSRLELENEEVVGIKQADGVTAMPNPSDRPLHELMGREMLTAVPPKFRDERRQSGSGLGNGESGNRAFTRDQLKNMSDADFLKNQEAIVKAAAEGHISD